MGRSLVLTGGHAARPMVQVFTFISLWYITSFIRRGGNCCSFPPIAVFALEFLTRILLYYPLPRSVNPIISPFIFVGREIFYAFPYSHEPFLHLIVHILPLLSYFVDLSLVLTVLHAL